MATYDPSAVAKGTTAAPTDRFYGGTNGTLANTLNIASPPNLMRIGVGVAVPAALGGLAYLTRKNRLACAALQGATLGAAIKTFQVLWNAYVMGNLLKPADTTQATMQASLGARLYPAEVVAAQNLANNPPTYNNATGLNAPPRGSALPPRQSHQYPSPQAQRGVGDPGPFAAVQRQRRWQRHEHQREPRAERLHHRLRARFSASRVSRVHQRVTPRRGPLRGGPRPYPQVPLNLLKES